jgi:hypothetical protein
MRFVWARSFANLSLRAAGKMNRSGRVGITVTMLVIAFPSASGAIPVDGFMPIDSVGGGLTTSITGCPATQLSTTDYVTVVPDSDCAPSVHGLSGYQVTVEGQAEAVGSDYVAGLQATAELTGSLSAPLGSVSSFDPVQIGGQIFFDIAVTDNTPGAAGGADYVPLDFSFLYMAVASFPNDSYQPNTTGPINVASVGVAFQVLDVDGVQTVYEFWSDSASTYVYIGSHQYYEVKADSHDVTFLVPVVDLAGASLRVTMSAGATLHNPGYASSFIDPTINISPGFADADRYTIVANPGLSVPEPAVSSLLGASLVALGLSRTRRPSKTTATAGRRTRA